MKISELIEMLQQYDGNMEVEVSYSDGGGFYEGTRPPMLELETDFDYHTQEPYQFLTL